MNVKNDNSKTLFQCLYGVCWHLEIPLDFNGVVHNIYAKHQFQPQLIENPYKLQTKAL